MKNKLNVFDDIITPAMKRNWILIKDDDTDRLRIWVPSNNKTCTIPKPKNSNHVFVNTMAFNLLLQKQRCGEWAGSILIEK